VLTEDDVVDPVCDHLETAGYEIMRRCATTQRGDDIVAVRRRSSIALYIEAKGETSNG
jgi:Holliday junction resolvase